MTSNTTFPQYFTRIDDLTRRDHPYLTEDDVCFYIGEYTAYRGYRYSHTNSLILNFKKSMDRQGQQDWKYKEQAIRQVSELFRTALGQQNLDSLTFVPIPPSKVRGDSLFDDRLTRMLHEIRPDPALDIRELIVQTNSTGAVHDSEERPRPSKIKELYRIDETSTAPIAGSIAVVDDVLTTGAHFRAAKSVLSARFPNTRIIGLFIARRAPETDDL